MEESVNISELEQTSLFNQNVSFNSMELTLPADSPSGKLSVSPMPEISFALSEEERLKLKRVDQNTSQRSVLKDISINVNKKQKEINLSKSAMDVSIDVDEEEVEEEEQSSAMEDSTHVIDIEDTVHEQTCEQSSLVEQLEQSDSSTVIPSLTYFDRQVIELGRRCWPSSMEAQHYTKGCYWSPDGTCLLLPVHQDGMHVMELPLDLYQASGVPESRAVSTLQSAVHIPEGGTVYDCVWYPGMNSQAPETCFWLASRQHEPIHMWDAFNGSLRGSFAGYDEVDEVAAAISLAFSNDGQQIFAGYKRCIKIFDTNRPGRNYVEYGVKFSISCIAQTWEHPQTLTCGNWRGYIQHFDLRISPKQGPLFTLGGHTAGITQLRYANDTSSSGWQLFSGARKCPKLLQWDMRNYKQPLHEFQRTVDTNQRIQFDLQQNWLASGDTNGFLNVWNLQQLNSQCKPKQYALHDDCCNGVSFHPNLPILATSSGQYHFLSGDTAPNATLNGTQEIETEEKEQLPQQQHSDSPTKIFYENAVLLLWCGS
ncbi:WDR79 [Drosophila busckii]|uniref:WD repeat-containing protein 79 n=1 Tax=Drosophila busckii TaxID=30019 RepID=A0A0M5IXX2_DROBS|nr:WDR79 [Drosophila busckii]